ncbi:hypothetical protein FKW77_002230 [Venturia effusa]|uniref:Protein kinase domain-containing protein n=1 Tax=Venturia effusa TaxID=50376 RepID=A0A517LGN9_9PEZI|nr:hypothetical protein FKW77_002230 [Venturia effusa]
MNTQHPQVMVSEWQEPLVPEIHVHDYVPENRHLVSPQVEVVIKSAANDGKIFFRRTIDEPGPATLFDWIETEVGKIIATKSLNKKHTIQIGYHAWDRSISKSSYDKHSFDEALREASMSSSTNIKITASLAPPQAILSRQRGYEILTRERIERTTGKYIVPQAALDEFRNEELLRDICAEDSDLRALHSKHPSFLQDLKQGPMCGLKLLAIFILAQVSDLGSMFCEFWEYKLLDHRLPFVRSTQPTFCEKQFWLSICDTQWQVLPIELARLAPGEPPAMFDRDRCLPFKESETPLGKGGFGVVVEVQLDSDHPQLYLAEDQHGRQVINPPLAAKKIKLESNHQVIQEGPVTDRETDILMQLAGLNHPHLINLITAFHHGDDYYMLFPKAKRSLKEWFDTGEFLGNLDFVWWMLRQVEGIARGLDLVHTDVSNGSSSNLDIATAIGAGKKGLRGHHGDIAPSNLLIMFDLSGMDKIERMYGRMQLTDFGVAKLMNELPTLSVYSTHSRGQWNYTPPECHGLQPGQTSGSTRWKDIWSFGCVLLEIFAWILEGKNAPTTFSNKRFGPDDVDWPGGETSNYFELNNDPDGRKIASLRKAVTDQITALRNGGRWPTETWSQIKPTVDACMDLVLSCLSIKQRNRPEASRVGSELEKIRKAFEARRAQRPAQTTTINRMRHLSSSTHI